MKKSRKSKKKVCKMKQCLMQYEEEKEWLKEEEDEEETEYFPKWVTHYCSDHQILLVGDGDFSFSLSLAKSFASASNIVASSLDTYDEVIKKYKNAKSNLEELQKLGAYLLHGVDATQMKFHPDLKMWRFDRIIFNFPHAGFHEKEDNLSMIKMHMDLVFGFFKNASHMLGPNGEIHVNHKTNPPFSNWNIEKLAEQSFLIMIECADFKQEDYPGYNNKRGDSYRCDDPFPLGKCSTFKFIDNPRSVKNHLRRNHMEVSRQQFPAQEIQFMEQFPAQEIQFMEQFPAPVDLNYHPRSRLNYYPETSLFPKTNQLDRYPPQTSLFPKLNHLDHYSQTSLFPKTNQLDYHPLPGHFPKMNEPMRSDFDVRNGYNTNSRDYINKVTEIHGRVASSVDCYHYACGITQDTRPLEPLQPWPVTTNCRSSLTDPLRRVAFSGDSYHRARDMTQDNQPLQPWPTPTNCRYSLTEPLRRIMDVAPSIPLGARNEGYQYQQVFAGRSSYLQEELHRSLLDLSLRNIMQGKENETD